MIVYKYGNYISEDKDRLEERISEDIAKYVKSIAKVESIAEDKYDDIEEITVNPQDIFRYMREAYVFLEYCAKEED